MRPQFVIALIWFVVGIVLGVFVKTPVGQWGSGCFMGMAIMLAIWGSND